MKVTITYKNGTWEEIYCLAFTAVPGNYTVKEKGKEPRQLFPNPNKKESIKNITIEEV